MSDLLLTAANWTTLSDIPAKDGKVALTTDTSGLHFEFPIVNPPKPGKGTGIDYLVTNEKKYKIPLLTGSVSINANVTTTGDASVIFSSKTEKDNSSGGLPPNVRLFFESDTKNLANKPYGRWWANPSSWFLLPNGSVTLSNPLTPDKWSSVLGEMGNASTNAIAGFSDAMANVKQIGVTFGGGNFFGHGVNVSGGDCRFTVSRYYIL